jgi:hypothetical protein
MRRQPVLDDAPTLQVADDGAIAVPTPPRPVVDADDAGRLVVDADAPRRTNLSKVEPLTGNPRRGASRASAAPPSPRPMWRWMSANR